MPKEEGPVVTFLGPESSYTHQAALSHFPPSTHTLTPLPTIADVFASVQSSSSVHGVVPFENSSNGSVVFTLDLFADKENKYPDILVSGEVYVRVSHCLLGYALGEEEGDLSRLTKLYSHPQAWGQCNKFLSSTEGLKTIERQDVSSTSRAAQLVAEDKSGTSAAISSRLAAETSGLSVLRSGIEDRKDNTTRFLVLRRRTAQEAEQTAEDSSLPALIQQPRPLILPDGDSGARYKTLLTFTIEHTHPGALAKVLQVFSKHGLNLTSINTRPSGVENWNYIFFVELQGRREEGGKGEVNEALRDLGRLEGVCRGWRWLGSWENALGR